MPQKQPIASSKRCRTRPRWNRGLADHLLHQLDELDVEDDEAQAARDIIYNLSDTGLLNCSLQDVIDGMDEPVSIEVAERALRIVAVDGAPRRRRA